MWRALGHDGKEERVLKTPRLRNFSKIRRPDFGPGVIKKKGKLLRRKESHAPSCQRFQEETGRGGVLGGGKRVGDASAKSTSRTFPTHDLGKVSSSEGVGGVWGVRGGRGLPFSWRSHTLLGNQATERKNQEQEEKKEFRGVRTH